MLKVVIVTWLYALSMDFHGISEAKPIAGLHIEENSTVRRMEIPKQSITREELIALIQNTLRKMASRMNVSLQTTRNAEDVPKFPEHLRVNSKVSETSSPKVRSSTSYQILSTAAPIDSSLSYPCRTSEGTDDSGSLIERQGVTDTGIPFIDNGAKLTGAEESLSILQRYGLEFTSNSSSIETYTPQVVKGINTDDLRPANIRLENLTIEEFPSPNHGSTSLSVPFEAIITFTREKQTLRKPEVKDETTDVIPTRDPPDDFPPYFETVLSLGKKTSGSEKSRITNPSSDIPNEVDADEKDETQQLMKKRQTPRVGDLIQVLGQATKSSKESVNGGAKSPAQSSHMNKTPRDTNAPNFSTVKLEESTTARSGGVQIFQRQEFDEEDSEENMGSLGSITDLLPLIAPILEDLSDPNTETDIGELIEAGLPLVQSLSQGNGENGGLNIVGLITPVLASLSAPNRNGNGTVLQTVLPLVLPLVTPFIGPLIGPIIQGSSNPADQGGSSITPLIQALAGPLSLPTEPGGISPVSGLISGIIASLSRDLKAGGNGGSDVGALISTLISGVIAGGSAGLSAGVMKPKPVQQTYGSYGQAAVPASSVDPLELLGSSVKDILGSILQLVKSVVFSVTGILGASSSEQPRPVYGPANAKFRVT